MDYTAPFYTVVGHDIISSTVVAVGLSCINWRLNGLNVWTLNWLYLVPHTGYFRVQVDCPKGKLRSAGLRDHYNIIIIYYTPIYISCFVHSWHTDSTGIRAFVFRIPISGIQYSFSVHAFAVDTILSVVTRHGTYSTPSRVLTFSSRTPNKHNIVIS